MKIGSIQIDFPLDAYFKLDGGAMFGVVPKPLWSRRISADDRNRIPLAARPMLLRTGERTVLVDTGIGHKWSDKEKDIYGIDHSVGDLRKNLSNLGVKPSGVTDVILTHLHFDHAGGTTCYDESEELKLTFPNATHHLQKENLEWALNPTERDQASYRKIDFEPLLDDDRLHTFRGNHELFPGISVIQVDGHTKGLQMIRVEAPEENQTLLYPTDLIPTSAHLGIPYIMGYDLWPLETLEKKKEFLPNLVANNVQIAFEHDRDITLCTIKEEDGQYLVDEQIF